jgi:hypothetical protein
MVLPQPYAGNSMVFAMEAGGEKHRGRTAQLRANQKWKGRPSRFVMSRATPLKFRAAPMK